MARPAATPASLFSTSKPPALQPQASKPLSPDDADCENCLTGTKLWLAAISLALANFVVVLDTTIANVSIPHIAGGLAVSPTQGTWAITSYAVADAISVPLTGWLAGRFGAVRWFTVALIGFAVFSMLCGLSRSLEALIVFRVLQGLSGGPLMPLSQTLLMRVFPKRQATMALALWAMTTTTAPILGPIIGGWISDNWSWPWIFFINVPIVVVCFFSVRALVTRYELPTERKPIDLVGLALLVVSVGAFQIMLDTGRESDWFQSSWIVALAAIAVVTFVAFLIWELTDANPIVDVRVFRHRGLAAGSIAVALGFGAFFASVVLTPLWLQSVLNYSAFQSGLTVAWVGVLAVALAPVVGKLLPRMDARMAVTGGVLWLGSMALLRAQWSTDSSYWALALPHLLQGAGMPFFFIGITALSLSGVPAKDYVSAAGLMSFLRTLSGAIGTALATTFWDTTTRTVRVSLVDTMNGAGATVTRLQGAGLTADQGRGVLDRLVEAQAATLAVSHVFVYASFAFILSAAAVWIAPRPARGSAPGGAH